MNIVKIVLPFFMSLLFALPCSSNADCELTIDKFPKIEGIALGITKKDFESKIASAAKKFSETTRLDDYEYYTSTFMKGKLISFKLQYNDKHFLKNAEEAVEKLVNNYGFPREGWKPKYAQGEDLELKCKDFSAWVSVSHDGRSGELLPPIFIFEDSKLYPIWSKQDLERQMAEIRKKYKPDFRVTRFYEIADGFYRIVVSTGKAQNVKCVIYDNIGEPAAVQTYVVTPPADEVQIYAGRASIKNVSCSPQ
ncbi:hypothetical protein [Methylomagnum ishizawai]|uniref:hypothetical protein n=1 Tax=Methylomagnum ishizawai TaxID=1760988 RepID=UPI001C329319|nr:hypothetical protein [Methylomagnum ishizawai]BBL76070.1 hypothetical protein MishRS11D_31680 [Methylomagnum ishizawai]